LPYPFFCYIIMLKEIYMAEQRLFLDASVLKDRGAEMMQELDVKRHRIRFLFPDGLQRLRLIEECRALNASDVRDPDNFDLMYDIMMQMLAGKPVHVLYTDAKGAEHLVANFLVTDRYMNLRHVPFVDAYPVVVNWMVEYIAAMLAKKFPRSLKDIQAAVSASEELMKKSLETDSGTVIMSCAEYSPR